MTQDRNGAQDDARRAGGWLRIDLDALAANYRAIRSHVGPDVAVGAAVKADAYGLGVERVAPCLHRAGCRRFFVATFQEGVALRPLLPADSAICVLNGPPPGSEADFPRFGLVPVLNSLDQIRRWAALQDAPGRPPCLVQLDSGMSRFGLSEDELRTVLQERLLERLSVSFVMSHLACADDPSSPRNETQRLRFETLRALLPDLPASLAASSGIFLGAPFHFDLVRPGYALYGGNPVPGRSDTMRPVVTLHAGLVQDRWIAPGDAVGYSARFEADRPSRIATLSVGYADGFPRRAGGLAHAVWPERPEIALPIVGRISMDCMTLDITALGDIPLPAGTAFELIGPHCPLDALATTLDTIGYELLTGLGQRYHREYIESSL
ncbi:alanine racemase [Swaminathania salitolerans]|uniref:Alanine racemase n=1 Tax=Swaminathania salitolerans TaxID=182838 RepID=A0A511BX78_9PROT|nr:alanine racemase [Swaminathania salitolerans]GBQ11770.1 alanine racemase [Swaminathania salitolerans LMG 21291]GEL02618.1 alanine racemase [Swaminathania salitolerans]